MEGGVRRTENQMSRAAVHVSRPVCTIEAKDHVRSSVWSLDIRAVVLSKLQVHIGAHPVTLSSATGQPLPIDPHAEQSYCLTVVTLSLAHRCFQAAHSYLLHRTCVSKVRFKADAPKHRCPFAFLQLTYKCQLSESRVRHNEFHSRSLRT